MIPLAADVRNPGDIKSAIDEMVERVGLPHIVINNAAGNFVSPTERLSSNAFKTVVDIVLNGTANVTLDVGKRLIAAKQGTSQCLWVMSEQSVRHHSADNILQSKKYNCKTNLNMNAGRS